MTVRERLERIEQKGHYETAERGARVRESADDAASPWVEHYRRADHGDLLYDKFGLLK